MPTMPATDGLGRWGKRSLVAFYAVFAIFVVNLMLGRGRAAFGWDLPVPLNDVGEYLALLLSALFFTIGTLIHEHVDETPAGDDRSGDESHQR